MKRNETAQSAKLLNKTRKKDNETFRQYIYRMVEIASNAKIEEDAVVVYIVNGIPDNKKNKAPLYECSTVKRLKKKLKTYTLVNGNIYDPVGIRTENKQGNDREANTSGHKQQNKPQQKSGQGNCYNCGDPNHRSPDCPDKSKGPKCYNCNEFGHVSKQCSQPKKERKETEKKVLFNERVEENNMRVSVLINSNRLQALYNTGSDVNLIRYDVLRDLNLQICDDSPISLRLAGGNTIKTVGSTKANIETYGEIYDIVFHVVQAHDLPIHMIIRKEFTRDKTVTIKNNNVEIRREYDDDDPALLMHIAIDINESEYEPPCEIKQIINKYAPNKTFKSSVELQIQTVDDTPVSQPPRRLPLAQKVQVEQQVTEWINDGIVLPFVSQYASPVVVVKKKNGTNRLCVDYRKLNSKTIKDRYPVPLIDEQLDNLQQARVFSTLDLRNGFFHVRVHKDSWKYLAFVTSSGQYTFTRAPFGFCNSPRVFQRYINEVFRELMNKNIVLLYMDDIIVLSKNKTEAMDRITQVLHCAAAAGLDINWKKCRFLQSKIEYLGHIIEDGKIIPSPDKTKAVIGFREPRDVKELQRFLGSTGYFRKFIKDYALIARPLSDLMRNANEFMFGERQKVAFEKLKESLVQTPVLKIYVQEAETELHTDACKYGFGAALLQRDEVDQQLHPVYFMSAKSSEVEERYDSYTLEVLAVVKAVAKFRVYLLDKKN